MFSLRQRRRRARLTRSLAFALAIAIVPVAGPAEAPLAPSAARAAGECLASWTQHDPASAWGSIQLMGAAALAGQPAWVVGLHTWDASKDAPIARWSGTEWHSVPSPWHFDGSLNAVSALSEDLAWTVGKRLGRAVVARWDGNAWSNVVPPPLGDPSTLTDVAGVSVERAWATGARVVSGRVKPYVGERTASGWLGRTPAIPKTSEAGLTAVEVAPGGRVWVGGWLSGAQGPRPWLLHRSGSGWQTMSLSDVPAGRAAITDFAFVAADDGWLSGYVETAGGGYEPVLRRWDGSSWTAVASPWTAADSVVVNGVAVDGQGRVTVAGTQLAGGTRRGVLATRDGSSWTVTALDPAAGWLMNAAGLETGSLVVGLQQDAGAALLACQDAPAAGAIRRPLDASRSWAAHPAPADSRTGVVGTDRTPADGTRGIAISKIEARDVTAQAGLEMTTRTWSSLVADFNGDGRPDIFLNNHTAPGGPELWLGSASGVFHKAAAQFSFEDRHGCAAADVNGDDVLDMHCVVGANSGESTWPNQLLLGPLEDGGTLATNEFGLLDAFGRGRQLTFLDLNDDAYPDLFVSNEPARLDGMPATNRLYRNVGGEAFVSAPEWGLDRSIGGNCVVARDIDRDGDDDLIVCASEAAGAMAPGIRLLTNTGTRFVDRTTAAGLAPKGELDVEVGDLNGDGRLDIVSLRRTALRVQLRKADGTYALVYSRALGQGVAFALGDVNRDSRPDIFVAGHQLPDLMLVNSGTGKAWTSMAVPQPSGSTDDVIALDYDGNGLTDFLSLNGSGLTAGPLKLIAFFQK